MPDRSHTPHAIYFRLAWLALQQLIKRGTLDSSWELHGIGALKDSRVEIMMAFACKSIPKFNRVGVPRVFYEARTSVSA